MKSKGSGAEGKGGGGIALAHAHPLCPVRGSSRAQSSSLVRLTDE
jgi:hypothetical protein